MNKMKAGMYTIVPDSRKFEDPNEEEQIVFVRDRIMGMYVGLEYRTGELVCPVCNNLIT